MVKIIIYTGLSLSFDEAKEILDSHDDVEVIYKRPIKRGDIGLAINEHPDIIGIIDGVFHQNSAVAHREILKAIDATGKVTSDDDVAVMLDSETLEQLSEPLINMEYTFTKAVKENIITEDEKDELLSIAKSTFYPKRNYAQTLNSSKLDDDTKDRLVTFIRFCEDIKKEDAKSLIRHITHVIE